MAGWLAPHGEQARCVPQGSLLPVSDAPGGSPSIGIRLPRQGQRSLIVFTDHAIPACVARILRESRTIVRWQKRRDRSRNPLVRPYAASGRPQRTLGLFSRKRTGWRQHLARRSTSLRSIQNISNHRRVADTHRTSPTTISSVMQP